MKLLRFMPVMAVLSVSALAAPIVSAGCNAGSYCNASTRASYNTLRAAAPLSTFSGYNAPGANIAVADHPASHYAYSQISASSASGAAVTYSTAESFDPATGTFYNNAVSPEQRLSGLGPDEYLCPANCPVNVSAPAGARVIDCFKICKKAPTYSTVTQAYQVVRPVIYVRYPVIVPAPAPVCPLVEIDISTRYGSCGY